MIFYLTQSNKNDVGGLVSCRGKKYLTKSRIKEKIVAKLVMAGILNIY
jgi:hypothetical protein